MLADKELILIEGDHPWGDPSVFEDRFSEAVCPSEWCFDGDPGAALNPEILSSRLTTNEGVCVQGDWKVVISSWGYRPKISQDDVAWEDLTVRYQWSSHRVTDPTIADLIEKINTYLRDTGDFHTFIDSIELDNSERVVFVELGS